ncbi:MAG: PTS sugar transporter subunit IIA [Fimbriimonadales bacterium]|nr:PTS sugar transporter subunit IIA [Fimbriimonadales bacterium]
MTRRRDKARRHPRGFTLAEMLVVIVIFAVGILVFARLWPRGFVALVVTRDYATAQALAQGELDFLEARAQDLPEMIVAARYRFVQDAGGNWVLVLEADKDTPPTELGPGGDLLSNGNILIVNPGGNNAEIFWRLYNGPNRIRRVLGEGGAIPSPKPVGNEFGGLRVLAFAPVMSDPNLQSLFLVYGADMVGRGLVGTVAVSRDGVDFDSLDGEKVYVLFLLVSPLDRPGDHLRALENIARHLRNDTFCRFLKQAKDANEILQILDEADNSQFG